MWVSHDLEGPFKKLKHGPPSETSLGRDWHSGHCEGPIEPHSRSVGDGVELCILESVRWNGESVSLRTSRGLAPMRRSLAHRPSVGVRCAAAS